MCGRFVIDMSQENLRRLCPATRNEDFTPYLPKRITSYNIAPSQPVIVVKKDHLHFERQVRWCLWGLLPGWEKAPDQAKRMINARAETAADKPTFRASMRHHRVLIPASGFYEWDRQRGTSQPYYLYRADGDILTFAGLWAHWLGPDGSEIETTAILTTAANPDLADLHHRMPVIVEPDNWDTWLDPEQQRPRHLTHLTQPSPAGTLRKHPVSPRVNRVRENDPALLEPVPPEGGQLSLF